jgi:hypothetical protein
MTSMKIVECSWNKFDVLKDAYRSKIASLAYDAKSKVLTLDFLGDVPEWLVAKVATKTKAGPI